MLSFHAFCGSTELEREKEERKDAELTVAGFKRQLATLRDKIASVDTDIEQYRALAQNLHRGTPRVSLSHLLSPLRTSSFHII